MFDHDLSMVLSWFWLWFWEFNWFFNQSNCSHVFQHACMLIATKCERTNRASHIKIQPYIGNANIAFWLNSFAVLSKFLKEHKLLSDNIIVLVKGFHDQTTTSSIWYCSKKSFGCDRQTLKTNLFRGWCAPLVLFVGRNLPVFYNYEDKLMVFFGPSPLMDLKLRKTL